MASALPAGWTEFADAASGNPYFHNAGTGETTWTRPAAVASDMNSASFAPMAQAHVAAMPSVVPALAPMAQASSPLPEGWAEFFDASSNKHYYHRAATGETTWTRPLGVAPAPAQFAMGGGMQFGGMPQMGMTQGAPMGMPQMGMPQMGMPQGSPMGMPATGATKVAGSVKAWNDEKGFGFIVPEDGGADVFVHRSSLTDGNMLEKGSPVLYELTWSEPKKKYAAMGVMGAMSNPNSMLGGGGIPGGSMPLLGGGGGPPGGGQPSDNLFVAGLPLDMTDDKLKVVFSGYGTVADCRVLADSGKPDRAALVRMADVAMATFMVNNLHGTVPAGFGLTMPLTIRFAESKSKGKGKGALAPDFRSEPYSSGPAPFPVGPVGGMPMGQAMGLPSFG